jgi:hypothetical protein
VSVINTERALDHLPATQETFDVGLFPRQWALGADGTLLLLAEFRSSRLDVFDVAALLQGGHEGDQGAQCPRLKAAGAAARAISPSGGCQST